MVREDYYQILGINTNATQQQIKNAYRRLALQYHPDRNRDNPGAAETMKKINEAYAVLSDPAKRRQYDFLRQQYGPSASDRFRQSYSEQDIFRGSDINQVFEEMARAFGFSSFDQVFRQMYGSGYQTFEFRRPGVFGRGFVYTGPFGRAPRYGASRQAKASLSRTLLGRALGRVTKYCLKRIWGVELPEQGKDWHGVITLSPQQVHEGGTIPYPHWKRSRELMVKIPSGIRDGQQIRLRGMGAEGKGGAAPGDLYLTVRVRKPLSQKVRDMLKTITGTE